MPAIQLIADRNHRRMAVRAGRCQPRDAVLANELFYGFVNVERHSKT